MVSVCHVIGWENVLNGAHDSICHMDQLGAGCWYGKANVFIDINLNQVLEGAVVPGLVGLSAL